ncbi:uncharacterized protein LOC128125946 [Lactuca sativa]|uniref:uncharacterized protein LOC128125946 n=1 Tax=Lactuca sativa TaxID=4236 RepID=UPI0022AEE21F|nr:uncharacterized protein LOC128125946 [Lactuca sativa]
MVKTQQSFDTSTLNDLYNLLRTHEPEVIERTEESKIGLGGRITLVSKVSEKEATENERTDDEGLIVNSYDKAIDFYSNNKKKFEKKESKIEDSKVEKKLKGDSGVHCHYCHAANRMEKALSLVAREEGEDKGTYKIWSSNSDDEEMHNPMHGAMYAKFEEDEEEEVIGCCLMTKNGYKSPRQRSETSEIKEEESVDCSQLSVNKTDTGQASTSKVCDDEYVSLKDSQIDNNDDEEDIDEILKENEIPRVGVDQVYGETEHLDKVMIEKGAHYIETHLVVYPNFKCSDDVIFRNQMFITTENVDQIKLEFNKMVEDDNKKTSNEGFFSNQSIVENNLTKNSYTFQRQKPQRKWVAKTEISKKQVDVEIKYLNETSNVISLSKDSISSVKAWHSVSKEKTSRSQTEKQNVKLSESPKVSELYISKPLQNEVELIDSVKSKVRNWILGSSLLIIEDPNSLGYLNFSLLSACKQGKQHRQGHPIVIDSKIVEQLEVLHIDLCGPSTVETLNKKWYILLKFEVTQVIIDFIKKIETSLKRRVRKINSDNGSQFKNNVLDSFFTNKGISHNFSSPYTPQQNGVVERCFIMNLKGNLLKFQSKADEGIF